MAILKFIQAQSFALQASGASAGDTSITLQAFKLSDGTTNITNTNIGDQCYGTLEPNNGTQEEAIQFTGVTQNANGTATLTGVSSTGFVDPYTVTSGLSKSHAGGVTFILSNDAAFYGNIRNYINSVVASGAPTADINTSGISQQATTAQINAGTATGSSGAHLFLSPDQFAASNYAIASGTVQALAGTSGTPSATNKFVTQASLKFGGTGADGALAISSGATNIDLASAAIVEKNYTSISITGTGSLTFTNPGTNGTIIVLKSQGNVTLTSSTAPMIDCSGIGGSAGGVSTAGSNGITNFATAPGGGGGGSTAGSTGGTAGTVITPVPNSSFIYRTYSVFTGGGGGGGGTGGGGSPGTGGGGGKGGGGLVIECAGSYNFTTASGISVAGKAGTNGGNSGGSSGGGSGGGGGGGGSFVAIYNTLTANSGTITVSGGSAGTAGTGIGGSSNAGGGAGGGSITAGTAGVTYVSGTNGVSGGVGANGYAVSYLNSEFV